MNKPVDESKIEVLFFERPIADLKKFAFKIARVIKNDSLEIRMGAICIEMPSDNNGIDEFYHWDEVKNSIDEFLTQKRVKIVVFSNYRIPDIEFILHAKRLGIKTLLIQEGLIYDGISINDVSTKNVLTSFVSYFDKSISYINTIFRMCKYEKRSKAKVLTGIVKNKKNITISLANSFSVPLRADYVLTMGKYWEKYYTETVGYDKSQIRLVGDHDLDDFEVQERSESAICYIATVLVEDGTIHKEDFIGFIKSLSTAIPANTKTYVKLHPRSDISLYKAIQKENVEFIDKSGFLPSVNLYIGHRGSLIGKALYESDNLILWQFPNEDYCFYEEFASAVVKNESDLRSAINDIDITKKTNKKRDKIESYYWKNPEGAIKSITNIIVSYMHGSNV